MKTVDRLVGKLVDSKADNLVEEMVARKIVDLVD